MTEKTGTEQRDLGTIERDAEFIKSVAGNCDQGVFDIMLYRAVGGWFLKTNELRDDTDPPDEATTSFNKAQESYPAAHLPAENLKYRKLWQILYEARRSNNLKWTVRHLESIRVSVSSVQKACHRLLMSEMLAGLNEQALLVLMSKLSNDGRLSNEALTAASDNRNGTLSQRVNIASEALSDGGFDSSWLEQFIKDQAR